ncbi:aspartate/glutamate racemase family protein [Acetobacter thailandicus]|uniref:aspartate/glutamate racemase family protein n=1 Tax=Acetobacter thailandicus TaxID=1502842 RepID=UPI001BA9441B|nr:aspartate/glutamate racemase family protein [Acetobacter thailandicus]MBS1004620.1 aspartate/glutamate racemase family protein [Acetobacter thailandicus]
MSFEASTTYYRVINETIRDRIGGLTSAELVLSSVNFQTIVDMQKSGRWDDAGKYLAKAARGLELAGSDCVLICAVTMHLVADYIEKSINIPIINIIDVTANALKSARLKKPLLLATKYTMEQGFYQERMLRHDVEVLVPDTTGREKTHQIIFTELCVGKIIDNSRKALINLIEDAKKQGADSVIFGCTEIGLILDPKVLPLPGFDSTLIHAEAAVQFALHNA